MIAENVKNVTKEINNILSQSGYQSIKEKFIRSLLDNPHLDVSKVELLVRTTIRYEQGNCIQNLILL